MYPSRLVEQLKSVSNVRAPPLHCHAPSPPLNTPSLANSPKPTTLTLILTIFTISRGSFAVQTPVDGTQSWSSPQLIQTQILWDL